jgi:hypothetical protein
VEKTSIKGTIPKYETVPRGTGERLPLINQKRQVMDDGVLLEEVTVQR